MAIKKPFLHQKHSHLKLTGTRQFEVNVSDVIDKDHYINNLKEKDFVAFHQGWSVGDSESLNTAFTRLDYIDQNVKSFNEMLVWLAKSRLLWLTFEDLAKYLERLKLVFKKRLRNFDDFTWDTSKLGDRLLTLKSYSVRFRLSDSKGKTANAQIVIAYTPGKSENEPRATSLVIGYHN